MDSATQQQELQADGPCLGKLKQKLKILPAGDLILREGFSDSPSPNAFALIINIYHYDQLLFPKAKVGEQVTRRGSEKDVEKLEGIFKQFNVAVYSPNTQTKEENSVIYVLLSDVQKWIVDFKLKIKEAVKKQKEENQDGVVKMACFVCIMGHGSTNGLLVDSKNSGISIENEIFRPFNNENFRDLCKQPKIFFTNCCRGNEPSRRVLYSDDFGSGSSTLPNITDFLIVWSTTPGNASDRDHTGSKFIKVLCQVLQKHYDMLILEANPEFKGTREAQETDIEKLLDKVDVEMQTFVKTYKKGGVQHSQTINKDPRSFGTFWWRLNDFVYNPKKPLPAYLQSSTSN